MENKKVQPAGVFQTSVALETGTEISHFFIFLHTIHITHPPLPFQSARCRLAASSPTTCRIVQSHIRTIPTYCSHFTMSQRRLFHYMTARRKPGRGVDPALTLNSHQCCNDLTSSRKKKKTGRWRGGLRRQRGVVGVKAKLTAVSKI